MGTCRRLYVFVYLCQWTIPECATGPATKAAGGTACINGQIRVDGKLQRLYGRLLRWAQILTNESQIQVTAAGKDPRAHRIRRCFSLCGSRE